LFSVKIKKNASKIIKKMEKSNFSKLKSFSKDLMFDPVPNNKYDLTKIAGSDSTYRARIGKYRITYCVFWNEKIVRIIFIKRRKESTYKRGKNLFR
jgi:mRNA-degrading endonuclease RelE of RelBE toxin-antitoxin system